MSSFSELGPNSGFITELYDLYLKDPSLVGASWAAYFAEHANKSNGHAQAGSATRTTTSSSVQQKATRLIDAYRAFGHLQAAINPIRQGVRPLPTSADLDIEFSAEELGSSVLVGGFGGRESMTVKDLLTQVKQAYCSTMGVESAHLTNTEARRWLQTQVESRAVSFSADQKRRILSKLITAELFESELHRKYVGAKRFSVQGGETVLAMLDTLVESAAGDVKEIIIGMPHRGRLNILANTVGKPFADFFSEFEDASLLTALGTGDVKYHLGYSSTHSAQNGNDIKVSLAPNPSHLEFVNPVVEGMARARQDLMYDRDRRSVLPVLLHGDAAFAGQGVVFETLQMSRVEAHATGGTLHIIVNNQVGFTTDSWDARSSVYCTDMAKAVEAPIFHVNAEDVESSCWVMQLALDYRLRFGTDVVVDLYCFRKYGHNEGDDPTFTQPLVYAELKAKQTIGDLYAKALIDAGTIGEDDAKALAADFKAKFTEAQNSRSTIPWGEHCPIHGRLRAAPPSTNVKEDALAKVAATLTKFPEGFKPHPKLAAILEKRAQTLNDGHGIEWGFAETLAFGSLLLEGSGIRLSGQDVERGTFSHRHLVLHDIESHAEYRPLDSLGTEAKFEPYNSILSETGVMGFEFGYSTQTSKSLTIWEAQFGDFVNGAQVIVDQFIAASESKWGQCSGLVLLLPHGYEGQGPEHSSARLERFLQLCADGNMTVAYPSSAASYFHLIRRQAKSEFQRPLIVMTPKSLLRLPDAAAQKADLTSGAFQPVIKSEFGSPEVVVMLSGKVYYDVAAYLAKENISNVHVLRVEQLYPYPTAELKEHLKGVKARKYVWLQEEPKNMGSWTFMDGFLRSEMGIEAQYVGRAASPSTATGSGKRHAQEQAKILTDLKAAMSTRTKAASGF